MSQLSIWIEQWKAVTTELVRSFLLYLPHLFGALVVLFIGWIFARVGRAVTARSAGALNRLFARVYANVGWFRVSLSDGAISIISTVVFWLVMLFVLDGAAKVAQLDFFSLWLDRILSYLPSLIVGALIAFTGYLAGGIIRDLVSVTFSAAGHEQSRLLGLVAQSAIFLAAVIVGLDQSGIDVRFLITVIGILVAATAASFTLAFGFGAQSFVSNLIGAYQMQRHLSTGQQVKIGDWEGEVLEMVPTGIILATAAGRMMLPGKVFHDNSISLLTPDRNDE